MNAMPPLPTLVLLIVGGLLLGSLLNIVIIRLPRERQLLRTPLHCTRTGEPLAWWQVLPLVGWLIQRGRSRDGRRLHWIFPLVEVISAALPVAFYLHYGFSETFAYLMLVASILIITGAIDWLHRYIYTFVILGGAVLVLLAGFAIPQITIFNGLLGALIGGMGFLILYMLGSILFPATSVPFGLGDVYLAIFIGAAVGLTRMSTPLLYGILMAGVLSAAVLLVRNVFKRETPQYIAYGTFLCLGTLLYLALNGLA